VRGPLGLTLRLDRIEPVLPPEFIRVLPDTTVGFALEFDDRPAFLTLDRPLLLALLAGLLGEQATVLPPARELTSVERDMVDFLMPQLLEPLRTGWPGTEAPRLALTAVGAPRSTCRLPPATAALAATLHLNGPFGEAPLTLLFAPSLLPSAEGPVVSNGAFDRPALEAVVRELPLEFSVDLGRARMTLGRLAALKTGDVVLLDQRIADPLRARVGGSERFEVWAGAEGRAQAVRVHALRKAS
jgi:flagellar motor switch protein FliM